MSFSLKIPEPLGELVPLGNVLTHFDLKVVTRDPLRVFLTLGDLRT